STSDGDDRVLRFSTAVASVFDEYVMYRPDLLRRWAEGEEQNWQAELWRRVVGRLGPRDLASRIEDGIVALRSAKAESTIGFERLHLFSVETLPPLFLRFFEQLAEVVPTLVYSLEPSNQYLGDVPSRAERAAADAEELDGHVFLTDVGRLSRDFQALLMAADDRASDRGDLFIAPGRSTLLHSVQSDILEFKSPPQPSERQLVAADDSSISIHACTGPMREAQVLHDLLRGVLEEDPRILPEDIVVMTPDLDTYAPVFRAVFGEREQDRIPFEVHDRKTRADAAFYDDFLGVLELLDSRFSVLDLVRLMDAGSLRESFRFNQDERARLTDLLSAAGVRWGIDASHRAELGFPREALHTWQAGLERLFLGFATMPYSVDVFHGVLPRGAPSLQDAELVARLSRLCDTLFGFQRATRRPLGLDTWANELARLCSQLFAEDDEISPAVRDLRDALGGLRTLAGAGGYSGAVSLQAVRRELSALLTRETPAMGFLRRGVTLTDLVPLRSVPFKVVCLVGMDEDAFPRSDDRPSFDRTRDEHRPGDRNKRDDDRHSFLQALLCARERLIITYSASPTGRRTTPNPSPVVWELREVVRGYYRMEGERALLAPVEHPLHAFDSAYFTDSELPRSFSARQAKIARSLSRPPTPLQAIELSAPPNEEEGALSPGELARWLWNPAASFIETVLKAGFEDGELYEPTGALTELTSLAASKVGDEALRAKLESAGLHAYIEAAPEFPDGSWGALVRRQLRQEIEALRRKERGVIGNESVRAELLEAEVGGATLRARLGGLGAAHRVVARFTKPARQAELSAWVEHLMMQAVGGAFPRTTHLLLRGSETRPKIVSFAPVDDPGKELESLVRVYRTCRESPLPLLERASRELAEAFAEGKDAARKIAEDCLKAQRRWDKRLELILGADDPFADENWAKEFERVALEVYGPLLKHRSER
ncbi:MAG: exodeoxyribonuclease V subunit gamma, partial [Deltaproteobacteria bacterium]|nr:exodeoxyribonuclease V subunit gamma [Deltaproteobacteria bacterium]